MTSLHWQAKLAAWTHDPAEKALVLLRDPAGHEGGTVRALRQCLFPDGLSAELKDLVKRADQWAAAADRPQFPREKDGGRYQAWAQVDFIEQPALIHPLSGQYYDELGKFDELKPALLKAVSLDHFKQWIMTIEGAIDWRRTALAFWRFGPQSPAADLGVLWSLLPADTRMPDHTIWSHLDLTGAFATAAAIDENQQPALLQMSFGPVQGFIAQARTTSDLWAGSHLLSCIVWEGLKVICEKLGPDAVIFPQLRGVPLVDVWLQNEVKLNSAWFDDMEWRKAVTDANPLFVAALPNKFVAMVPADQARQLADEITGRVRHWVKEQASGMLNTLLETANFPDPERHYPCWKQLEEQLDGFPEVHWAAAPWSLIGVNANGGVDATELELAQAAFFPPNSGSFLDSSAWRLLQGEIACEGAQFYKPNPGVLYPAVYELMDRLGGAAKSIRAFNQLDQKGYRCSLSGETEWLTTYRAQLLLPPGKRKDADTLWNRIERKHPSWARKGEHLGALAMLKRLWPNRFLQQMKEAVGDSLQRYVVSTHTMALTTSFGLWLDGKAGKQDLMDDPAVCELAAKAQAANESVALPKKIADRLRRENHPLHVRAIVERLPALLDEVKESENDQAYEELSRLAADVLGAKPETYYALILMDGDNMGAWLSGGGDKGEQYRLPYEDFWHKAIHNGVGARFAGTALERYFKERRAVSPARHMAISVALSAFSLHLARYVVEDVCKGKLIYSGGDDVLAMVAVDDLLPAMLLLRLVYSGIAIESRENWRDFANRVKINAGHVHYQQRLYRLMGQLATASCGAVVAHHTAPLGAVLKRLRDAERRAKNQGGRDAFAITLLKRSGSFSEFTCKWRLFTETDGEQRRTALPVPLLETPMGLLLRLRDAFAGSLSRRAAYHIQSWVEQLPPPALVEDYESLLISNLIYQFYDRQGGGEETIAVARQLGKLAIAESRLQPSLNAAHFIRDFLTIAEFLAREGRTRQES